MGEGNGNPLQCSCLENPRDGGAWWAAVCGVAQSQTRLKRLSSSSSSSMYPSKLLTLYFYLRQGLNWATCLTRELPRCLSGKEFTCQRRRCKRHTFDPCVGKIPWRREWQLTPVFLPEKSHAQRSLAGCSPWSLIVRHYWATERMYMHTYLRNRPYLLLLLLATLCHSCWHQFQPQVPPSGVDRS